MMGQGGGQIYNLNTDQGMLYLTSQPDRCSCPLSPLFNRQSLGQYTPFVFDSGRTPVQSSFQDAIATESIFAAQQAPGGKGGGGGGGLRSQPLIWQQGGNDNPYSDSGSFVPAGVFQNGQVVSGLQTQAGRQYLRVQNGVVDLRYFLNANFDDYYYERTAEFWPAGAGASFGYLHWLQSLSYAPWLFLDGEGGISRTFANDTSVRDPRDPNLYNPLALAPFKYETYTGAYFYYRDTDISQPRHVAVIEDRLGYSLYYKYGGPVGDQLQCIYGDVGRLTPYFWLDINYHIKAMLLQDATGVDNRATYYSYDATNGLQAMLEPADVATYFNITGAVRKMNVELDGDGYATYFYYNTVDSNHQLDHILESGRVTYFYDDGGGTTGLLPAYSYSLRSGRKMRESQRRFFNNEYHDYGVVLNIVGPSVSYYIYDPVNERQIGKVDPNGYTTYFGLNPIGLTSQILAPDGSTPYYYYAANNVDLIAESGPRNGPGLYQMTYYGYDAGGFGLRTQILNALGQSVYFNYDSRGRLANKIDARGGPTYYSYDQYSQNNIVVDGSGNAAYFSYNANRRVLNSQDARGKITYFTYDSMDQLKSKTLPTGEQSTWTYNKRGLKTQEGGPGGRGTLWTYDAFKNLIQAARISNSGYSITYFGYDDFDNRISIIDPNGNPTLNGFDVRNLLVQTQDALGNTTYYGYDLNGNLIRVLDADQHSTYFVYDSLNRPVVASRVGTAGLQSAYFYYDKDGNVVAVLDERSSLSYFGYDALNRSTVAQDALGSVVYYSYDPNGNISSVLNARMFTTSLGYDVLNRPASVLDAVGRSAYFVYDTVGNRTAIIYPDRTAAYFAYDASGRIVIAEDPSGYYTNIGYDVAGNFNRLQDPRGNATYFQYDLLDRSVAALNALQQPVYFAYDAAGNLLQITDHIGAGPSATTYYVYDVLNRPSRIVDAIGRAGYFAYDPVGNPLKVTYPGVPLQTTYFSYDLLNRTAATLDSVLNATYFGYDVLGNLTQTLNPRLNAAYFGYDALNRMTQAADAVLNAVYFVYDANGNVIRSRDPRQYWTYFQYDGLDRVIQVTDARNAVATVAYNTAGRLAVAAPPVGNATYFYYEPRQLLSQVVDGVGNSKLFYYDANGNLSSSNTVALAGYGLQPYGTSLYGGGVSGFSTYYRYDALNRLSGVLDAQGGSAYFGYDVAGNLVAVLDPLLRASYFGYDLLDRPTRSLDAQFNSAYFAYDAAGNRSTTLDALQHATYYGFDGVNRLVGMLDPLLHASYFGYDANSNLAKTLDNNGVAVYFSYDTVDRRTAIAYPAENQFFGFDAGSNLVQSVDGWGASYFGYDELSRVTKRVTPRLDAVYYAYDAASDLTAVQYPQDNKTCYYGYDGALRLVQALSPYGNATYWNYDQDSNIDSKIYGNTVVANAQFDNGDRMTMLHYSTSANAPVVSFDYNRDLSGRVNIVGREASAGYAIYYSYDNIDRLLSEIWRKQSDNSQVYAFSYSYDAAGNRVKMRLESTAGTEVESTYYAYAADNSMIRRHQGPLFVDTYFYYDANGSLTTAWPGGGTAATYYGYGAHGLMTRIAPASGAPAYFYYDSYLNRYCINNAGTLTYYLWDGLSLLEERNNDGSLKARYTHGNSGLPGVGTIVEVQRNAGGGTYFQYLAADQRGSVLAVTDAAQATQLTYTLDAFGRQLAFPGGANPAVPNDFIVQPNALTLQIGGDWYLVFKYRVLRINDGVFLSRDFLPFLNKYSAWSNNPVNRVDPTGLADCGCPTSSGGGVSGGSTTSPGTGGGSSVTQGARAAGAAIPSVNVPHPTVIGPYTPLDITVIQNELTARQIQAFETKINSENQAYLGSVKGKIQGKLGLLKDSDYGIMRFAPITPEITTLSRRNIIATYLNQIDRGDTDYYRKENAPLLGLIRHWWSEGNVFQKGISVPLIWYYSVINTVGIGGLEAQDYNKGDFNRHRITPNEYNTNLFWNSVRQGTGAATTLLPFTRAGGAYEGLGFGSTELADLAAGGKYGVTGKVTSIYQTRPYTGNLKFLNWFGLEEGYLVKTSLWIDPALTGADLARTTAHEGVHLWFARNVPQLALSKRLPYFGSFVKYGEELIAYSNGAIAAGSYSHLPLVPWQAVGSLNTAQKIYLGSTAAGYVGGYIWYFRQGK